MSRWLKIMLIALGVICVALVIVLWLGSRRERNALSTQLERLRAEAVLDRDDDSIRVELDGVPPPVRRYLAFAIRTHKRIQEVRIGQTGTLRTDVRSQRWMPFEAQHFVVPPATGFVWDARVQVAPLLHVRVRDALVGGQGSGHVSLLSAIRVSAAAHTPEMNSGSLHRYLAEAVWYPTALWPSRQLQWIAIDGTRALATLTNQGVSVSLEFRFGESGEVTGIYTPARWGTFPEGYRQAPWEGHFRNYRQHGGLMVPADGDVGWYVDGKWRTVWTGAVVTFEVQAVD